MEQNRTERNGVNDRVNQNEDAPWVIHFGLPRVSEHDCTLNTLNIYVLKFQNEISVIYCFCLISTYIILRKLYSIVLVNDGFPLRRTSLNELVGLGFPENQESNRTASVAWWLGL